MRQQNFDFNDRPPVLDILCNPGIEMWDKEGLFYRSRKSDGEKIVEFTVAQKKQEVQRLLMIYFDPAGSGGGEKKTAQEWKAERWQACLNACGALKTMDARRMTDFIAANVGAKYFAAVKARQTWRDWRQWFNDCLVEIIQAKKLGNR